MNDSKRLPVLIFNSTSPKFMGGVKRAYDELVTGFNSTTRRPFFLIGKKVGKSITNFLQVFKEFCDYMKKVKVIHFIVLSPYNVPFIILAKLYRKKIISTYHGNSLLELWFEKKIFFFIVFWISDKIFRFCSDIITSPTQKLLDQLNISNTTAVIPNLYNTKLLHTKLKNEQKKSDDNITLVTASNFNIKKKCDYLEILFEAMNLLEHKVSPIELLVFGDGKNLAKFKKKYEKNKNIIFMGFRKDIVKFLNISNAYLHITGLDNQPYSIIEAMMLEKVILCNEFDGMAETLEAQNNYVVTAESNSISKGLISIINDIQNNSEKFHKRGEQNKKYAISRYSSDIIIPKYLEIYRKLSCSSDFS